MRGFPVRGRGLAAAALALLAAGPALAATCDPEGPAQVLRAIIAADNARDLKAVMKLYTKDAAWLPIGREATRGAAAIKKSYEQMYADTIPELAITTETVKIAEGGDMAVVEGRTSGTLKPAREGGETRTVDDGYTALLLCERGKWRVRSLSWGGGTAPESEPEPASP